MNWIINSQGASNKKVIMKKPFGGWVGGSGVRVQWGGGGGGGGGKGKGGGGGGGKG